MGSAMSGAAHTDVSAATVINGQPVTKALNSASTYKPGSSNYMSDTKTATALDLSTAAHGFMRPFILEFLPRVTLDAGARKDADDTVLAADNTPYIIGGRRGPVQIVTFIDDPGADVQKGHWWQLSTNVGAQLKSADGAVIRSLWNAELVTNTHVYARMNYV